MKKAKGGGFVHNVFIVTGPLVLLATADLIKQRFGADCIINHIFLFGNISPDVLQEVPSNNVLVTTFKGMSLIARARDLVKFKRDLRNILRSGSSNLFVGNCCHMATNYAALSRQFVEKNIVVEGVGNYYFCDFERCGDAIRLNAKRLLGLLLGMPYRKYRGHLSGADTGKFRTIFCYNEKMLVSNPGHVDLIERRSIAGTGEKTKVIMVLDQPIEKLVDRNSAERVRAAIVEYVERTRKPGDTIYYKPHPSSTTKGHVPSDWTLITDPSPAEVLVVSLGVNHCVSFASSVLQTAKDMFDGVSSTSIGLNLCSDENARESLQRLFEAKNVEIIRV